uniref:Uncharacterized protein n=1 Tax=Avena sativa TaxID=4498 RepID=A0ACD5U6M6_AVESA
MGSNEPLGKPIEVESLEKPIDLEGGETNGEGFVQGEIPINLGVQGLGATTPSPSVSTNNKKRKRVLSDEDAVQVNMSNALRDVAGAINNTCHTETHPDLCKTVMDLTNFDMDERLAILDYLMEHKGKGLKLMKMEADVREASLKRIIAKNPDLV